MRMNDNSPQMVELIPDVCYSTVEGKRLLLDILRPAEQLDQPIPVIVEIHAGGWAYGEKYAERNRPFANLGYFTVSLNYRLADEAIFPAQIDDVKQAIRWLKTQADTYHIDPQHIGIWGVSSGGHLAALLGTSGVEDASV